MQQKNTIIDILTMEKGVFPGGHLGIKKGGNSGIWNSHNFATTGPIFTNEGLKFLSLWVLIDKQEIYKF